MHREMQALPPVRQKQRNSRRRFTASKTLKRRGIWRNHILRRCPVFNPGAESATLRLVDKSMAYSCH